MQLKYFLKSNKNLILINIFLVIFFLFIPPTILYSSNLIRKIIANLRGLSLDKRAYLDLYKDKQFSHQLFREKKKLNMEYKSFIGWRPKPVKYKFIKINKQYNTRFSFGQKLSESYWFFGGSTMWGFGTSDEGTIPSLYSKKTNLPVFNFGEQSWVSRQSLNQFLTALGDGNKPKAVIFYGGINDVSVGCKKENSKIPVHTREKQISNIIKDNKKFINQEKFFSIFIRPYSRLGQKLFLEKSSMQSNFECLNNNDKSLLVASNLVENWYSAFIIAKQNKVQFFAVLQPYNQNSSQYILKDIDPFSIKQYEKVYSYIRKQLQNKCLLDTSFCDKFFDGTKWLSLDSDYFIDECHLVEKGNQIIADNLIKLISRN